MKKIKLRFKKKSNYLEIKKVKEAVDKVFRLNMRVHIYPTSHDILVEKFKCHPENLHFSEILQGLLFKAC